MPPKPAEVPAGPPMQKDVHFVLRVTARLKPSAPPPAPDAASASPDGASAADETATAAAPAAATAASRSSTPATPSVAANAAGAAAATAAAAAGAAAAAAVQPDAPIDPSTMFLQLQLSPWVGDPVTLAPVPMSTAAADDGTEVREYKIVHHFKATVDEGFVRAMAAAQGALALPLVLATPPPPLPPKGGGKKEPPPPPPPSASFSGTVPLDCSGLLVGDKSAQQQWPGKRGALPGQLAEMLQSVEVSLQALSFPEKPPEPAAPAGGKAAAKAPAKGATPEPELQDLPGEPMQILTPHLALKLNPIVILPVKAKGLPDAPATRQLLDQKCAPIKLRISWPPKLPPREQQGLPGPWVGGEPAPASTLRNPPPTLDGSAVAGAPVSCRDVVFGEADVILAADHSLEDLLRACRETPLHIEVHDRTAIPDPPEFPIARGKGEGAEAAAAPEEDEGYVCGVARIPLLELSKGYTLCKFRASVVPYTTIRGAASLDWTTRPGNYAQVDSVLKVTVRTAVPLAQTVGVSPKDKVFGRAVFVMDYRDSDLFHTLEDTVRRQNAWRLGLAEPVIPAAGSALQSCASSRRSSMMGPNMADDDEDGMPLSLLNTTHSTVSVKPAQDAYPARPTTSSTTQQSLTGTGRRRVLGAAESPAPGDKEAGMSRQGSGGLLRTRRSTGNNGGPELSAPTRPGTSMHHAPGGLRHASGDGGTTPTRARMNSDGMPAGGGGGPSPERTLTLTEATTAAAAAAGEPPGSPGKKALRFRRGSYSDDGSDASSEEPLSAVEIKMNQAMGQLEHIALDMRLIQSLSTCRLTPEQAADTNLDLLTGFHLVDGKERVIVLEGLVEGDAMRVVSAIMEWALSEPSPEDGWHKRTVTYNPSIRYSTRLWPDLGVDLYIIKLRAPLPKLIAEAGSYATGKVRVDCIQGLRKLGQLRTVTWSRLADDLCMYPSPHMIRLVDKKFGGELSKADVLGAEVAEFDSDEEDGGAMGLVPEDAKSVRSARSHRSNRSKMSRKSKMSNKSNKYKRKRPLPEPLDLSNEAYLIMRQEARNRRLATNWLTEHLSYLEELAVQKQELKASWSEWNPQREATKKLETLIHEGHLTLHDTITARSAKPKEPIPGAVGPDEALQRGWYPHDATFKWPAPRAPDAFVTLPNKPTDFRIQQLQEHWQEGEMFAPLALRPLEPSLQPFTTTVKNQAGTFEQNPEFFKTLFLGGEGKMKEEQMVRDKAISEWKDKIVVDDPVMRVTLPQRAKPSQTDRVAHILLDPPKKKGFAISHVPPAPYSMFKHEERSPGGGLTITRDEKFDPKTSLGGRDFVKYVAKDKRDVHKLSLNQSWQAALHDSYVPAEHRTKAVSKSSALPATVAAAAAPNGGSS